LSADFPDTDTFSSLSGRRLAQKWGDRQRELVTDMKVAKSASGGTADIPFILSG
jgi:hypothetical protein